MLDYGVPPSEWVAVVVCNIKRKLALKLAPVLVLEAVCLHDQRCVFAVAEANCFSFLLRQICVFYVSESF